MFSKLYSIFLAAGFGAAIVAASPVLAHEYKVGELSIGHPFARSTPPGAVTAGAYLSIANNGKTGDKLLRAVTPAAGLAELHSMSMDGSVMRMRPVSAIDLPPGTTVKLAPGGLHVMMQDLKRPLKKGDRVPLTLSFERAGDVKVELSVEDAAPAAASTPAAQGAHSGH